MAKVNTVFGEISAGKLGVTSLIPSWWRTRGGYLLASNLG